MLHPSLTPEFSRRVIDAEGRHEFFCTILDRAGFEVALGVGPTKAEALADARREIVVHPNSPVQSVPGAIRADRVALAREHKLRVRALLAALAVGAGIILALALTNDASASPAKSAEAPACVHEDEPCWRWSKMGNLKRGVILHSKKYAGGYFKVVEPCDFAYLDFKGRIDWTRTKRLKGDGFARRHGCDPYLYA